MKDHIETEEERMGDMDSSDFVRRYGPWALIAGASEGIGRSFAEQLAARGLNLILLARRPEVLEATAEAIRSSYGVQVDTHSVDLTADDLCTRLDELIGTREIGFFVYNAGATHGASLFHDAPVEKALRMVRLNCVGPILLTHRLGSAMKERGRGGMVLLSSMSGMIGGAYIATYAATKSFDLVFATSLWAELKYFGIDVLGLVAGATRTPAATSSGIRFAEQTEETLDAADVVAEALAHLNDGPLWFPGERNQTLAPALRAAPLAPTVERISSKAAYMYGLPWPIGKS